MFAFSFELLDFLFEFLGLGKVVISQFKLLSEVNFRFLAFEFKVAPPFMEELHLVLKVIELELTGLGGSPGFIQGDLDFFGFLD